MARFSVPELPTLSDGIVCEPAVTCTPPLTLTAELATALTAPAYSVPR